MLSTKVKALKTCALPDCPNTSLSAPNKFFFCAPKKSAQGWFQAIKVYIKDRKAAGIGMGPISFKGHFLVCEDHFDLEKDTENFMEHKLIGSHLRLKKGIVPHIFGLPNPKELSVNFPDLHTPQPTVTDEHTEYDLDDLEEEATEEDDDGAAGIEPELNGDGLPIVDARFERLNGQSKEVLANVIEYFKEMFGDAESAEIAASRATGVHLKKVRKVTASAHKRRSGAGGGRRKNKGAPKEEEEPERDACDPLAVRKFIQEHHVRTQSLLSFATLLRHFNKRLQLKRALAEAGFAVRTLGKTKRTRKMVLEDIGVEYDRVNFLRKLSGNRLANRRVVYTCEVRFRALDVVALHAADRNGFLPDSLVVARSVDRYEFERWLLARVVPNLRKESLVVLPSTPTTDEPLGGAAPTYDLRKRALAEWLAAAGVPHAPDALKPELWRLVRAHDPPPARRPRRLEAVLARRGHRALWVPRREHAAGLNPVENFWRRLVGSGMDEARHLDRPESVAELFAGVAQLWTPLAWNALWADVAEREKFLNDYGRLMEGVVERGLAADSFSSDDSDEGSSSSGDGSDDDDNNRDDEGVKEEESK